MTHPTTALLIIDVQRGARGRSSMRATRDGREGGRLTPRAAPSPRAVGDEQMQVADASWRASRASGRIISLASS